MMTTGMRSSLPITGSAALGQLVGQRQDRRLQHVAGGVELAEIALDRLEAGQADRDVDEPLAPGPAERVGDDDGRARGR